MSKALETVLKALGGLVAFTYLLYFVGRTYLDTYLSIINIPKGLLQYNIQDYIYIGARPDNLLFVLVFILMIFGLLSYTQNAANTRSPTGGRRFDIWFVLFYLVDSAVAMILTLILVLFFPHTITQPVQMAILLITSIMAIGISIMVLYFAPELRGRILENKIYRQMLIICTTSIILFLPFTCATGWSAFRAIQQADQYPLGYSKVALYSQQSFIKDIGWIKFETGYTTAEPLYFIQSDNKYIIVRLDPKSAVTYIIDRKDISSLEITH